MKSYFIILIVILLSPRLRGQDTIHLPVMASVGSGDSDYLLLFKEKHLNTTLVPQTVLYPEKRDAKITRLTAHQLRIEFDVPFKFSIYNSNNQNFVADRVVKSFVVNTSVEYADRVMSLADGEYLIMDEIVRDHINEFVDNSERDGYDKFIKQYVNHRSPPRLLHFLALSFHLNLNQVGAVDGAPLNFSVTSQPQLLPWDQYNPAGTNTPRDDLIRLIDVYSANDPFIIKFQKQMNNLIHRMRQLMVRGWLDGLKSKSYFENQIEEGYKVESEKVVDLSSRLRCSLVFTE